MAEDKPLKKELEELLEQFTNYEPGMESYEFSIDDHMFLDYQFWNILINILKENQ